MVYEKYSDNLKRMTRKEIKKLERALGTKF
jgi:hypothetical protein